MKVILINMPFGYLRLPSIALTQLRSAIQQKFDDTVEVRIQYLNLDFGQWLGKEVYDFISESPAAMRCNIGEWLFRDIAFPETADDPKAYLEHFQLMDPAVNNIQGMHALRFFIPLLLAKRNQLDTFLESLITKYDLLTGDIVGFTSMFAQNLPSFALARKLKKLKPELVIIMGGANCESPMGEGIASHIPQIDFVFSGPALVSLPRFVDAVIQNQYDQLDQIDGVFSKRNITAAGKANLIKNKGQELSLNQSTELDYEDYIDLVRTDWKNLDITPVLLFETSRGCWWGAKAHCTFCGLNANSMNYRSMEPEFAVDFLNNFFKQYGSRVKHYSSVDNIMPVEYIESVFPHLRPPENASLFYEVKADLSKASLQILARARVLTLQPGIESLNTATLKLMKKGETAVGNIALLKNAAALQIDLAWNLLIGFPGEVEADYDVYNEDLSMFYHLQPPKSIYDVRFDRYSPYFNTPEKHGLHLVPADFYFFLYPECMHEVLPVIAYYFEDINEAADYRTYKNKWRPLLQRKINDWVKRYEASDGLAIPRLYLDRLSHKIFDSRSGSEEWLTVSELELSILFTLDQPCKWTSLCLELNEVDSDTLKFYLESLIAKKLVYHEKHKKYLSLVAIEQSLIDSHQQRLQVLAGSKA